MIHCVFLLGCTPPLPLDSVFQQKYFRTERKYWLLDTNRDYCFLKTLEGLFMRGKYPKSVAFLEDRKMLVLSVGAPYSLNCFTKLLPLW